MAKRYTRRYKADGKNCNVLDAEIYYSLGGFNYFTHKTEPRGYYFALQPLEVKNGSICFVAFSGVKFCVLPCERQSKKRFEQAKGMMDELVNEYMPSFCEENGNTVLDGGKYTEKED